MDGWQSGWWPEPILALMSGPVVLAVGDEVLIWGCQHLLLEPLKGRHARITCCFLFFHRRPWRRPSTFLTLCLRISITILATGIGRCG